MNTDKTPTEPETYITLGDNEYYYAMLGGACLTDGHLRRCSTCWATVWHKDEERHTAWHQAGQRPYTEARQAREGRS